MTVLQSDLHQARHAAIDESGVAYRFVSFQPRNPAFWVYLVALIIGFMHVFTLFQPSAANYGGPLLGGFVAFVFYTTGWVLYLHSLDRFTPMSPKVLAIGFLWGGAVATSWLAVTANGAVDSLTVKSFGPAWAADWGAGVSAPFDEEIAKAIGFILLLGVAPLLIRSALDAFIVGAFIGLGFEVVEDVLYVVQAAGEGFGTNQLSTSVSVTLLRVLTGAVSHAMFTAFVCCGLMWIVGRDPRGRHVVKGMLLILFAVVMHGLWDTAGVIGLELLGDASTLWLLLLLLIGVAAVLWLGHDAAQSERSWARDILAPEVEAGAISEAELQAISGDYKHRRAYVKSIHGRSQRRRTRHILAAGRDLCTAIGRADGEETPEVKTLRADVARLRDKGEKPAKSTPSRS
ncbi:MAG: PrsW family intramembrane metalloprotease [Ornithinimicrobium sp.]